MIKFLEKYNFDIVITGNFLTGGKYRYTSRRFHRFFSKDSQSLYNFIMNNQSLFMNYAKSKRDKNNKLLIRKSDNYDFLKLFSINQIYKTSYTYVTYYDPNSLYFTDCGIITLNEWISLNEESLI